jgi:hypothetical protein
VVRVIRDFEPIDEQEVVEILRANDELRVQANDCRIFFSRKPAASMQIFFQSLVFRL